MEQKYKIGQYEFDTYEEYLDGLDDVKKIKDIIHEVDIYDEDASLRLYKLLRSNKITFKSKVGKGFFVYVSDIVANHSHELSLSQYAKELEQPQNSKTRTILGIVLIVIAIVCCLVFALQKVQSDRNTKNMTDLQEEYDQTSKSDYAQDYEAPFPEDTTSEEETELSDGESQDETTIDASQLTMLAKLEKIYQKNSDTIGWLKIKGTDINYPVMQIVGDNSYYLKHNFDKEEDKNGSLFLDGRNDFVNRDTNLIIYGHNMRSGAMFGTLKSYLDESYYKAHKTISFDTLYEKQAYKVVGVGLSKVAYQDDESFRYYDFLNADSKEEFDQIVKKLNKLSVYGKIDISYGDELLTLSTCNSYVEDGRMFVIAKKE